MNMKQQSSRHEATGFAQSIRVFKITAAAIFAALVFVVTSQIPPIPIPATSGYFNLGETPIYIAALLFGPLVGAVAGGIGSSISDAFLGCGLVCSRNLFIKGREGLIVGFLNKKLRRKISNLTFCATISVVIGGLEMVAGYFLYETIRYRLSFCCCCWQKFPSTLYKCSSA